MSATGQADTGATDEPGAAVDCQGAPTRRAADGPDRAATTSFDDFVLQHGARLTGLARRSLRDPHAAEDVLQDVLARAYLRWDRISRLDDPVAYVNRMVVNACTSWWRRAARRETPVGDRHDRYDGRDGHGRRGRNDPYDAAVPAQDASLAERDHMLALLRRLPGKQRVVLVLRHYERMDDEEIARLLGVSTGTVRSNAFRGLARLREHLQG